MPGWIGAGEDGSIVQFAQACDVFRGMDKGRGCKWPQNVETLALVLRLSSCLFNFVSLSKVVSGKLGYCCKALACCSVWRAVGRNIPWTTGDKGKSEFLYGHLKSVWMESALYCVDVPLKVEGCWFCFGCWVKIVISSMHRRMCVSEWSGVHISCMKRLNNLGDNIEPCATLLCVLFN